MLPIMSDAQAINTAVAQLYNTYPFPPDPLSDQPPPGYNWRWHWVAAHSFCTGQKPLRQDIRILDAGCGTGSSTDYLIHLNPKAQIVAIDLSEKALCVAKERIERSRVIENRPNKSVEFIQLKIEEVEKLPGEFDFINCVGVLHHLPDPIKGIQALAAKLAPGGLMHIFVYAELGRWEIRLMQQAIALLQQDNRGDYQDGVEVGRQLFSSLPENNRLVKREKERWSFENLRDACFADMYVHPQEIDYNIENLFELIEASGLEFLGFSNPQYWQLERLIAKSPQLLKRAENLSIRQRYRLIELLDSDITHYEFFLGRSLAPQVNWSDDATLFLAIPERNPCMNGWPSRSLLNYEYQITNLSEAEFEFLQACDGHRSVKEILSKISLSLDEVRSLQQRQLIVMSFGTE
jgi:SAM-dependent methyltransferase